MSETSPPSGSSTNLNVEGSLDTGLRKWASKKSTVHGMVFRVKIGSKFE